MQDINKLFLCNLNYKCEYIAVMFKNMFITMCDYCYLSKNKRMQE